MVGGPARARRMEVIEVASVRNMAVPLGIAAAALILLLVNPWVAVEDQYRSWIGYAFWIVAIALIVVLYLAARSDADSDKVEIEGPAFARFLFNNSTRRHGLAADPPVPRIRSGSRRAGTS